MEQAHEQEHEHALAELSIDNALELAVALHRSGHLDDAQALYRRIHEAAPGNPDALQFLGVLAHQRGDSARALHLLRASTTLDPGRADLENNLGNVLKEVDRLDEAAAVYRRAIALDARHASAHNNLGAVLRLQGRTCEAEAAYRSAIACDPAHVDAHNNLGNLLSSLGRVKEAVAYYCTAITLMPGHPHTRKLLGIAYYTIGQVDAAAAVFRTWLQDEPDNPVARHLHAACSGEQMPERACDAYVEETFDAFASSFDGKLERLAYRAPHLVAQALSAASPQPQSGWSGLDVGCGTGLCGPLIAPWLARLAGVDLSAGMLERARARGVYDALVKAELSAYLDQHPGQYELVVSADTLVYFGALEAVLGAAWRALRPGGLMIFTVEQGAAGAGYRIHPHGRYSHGEHYVRQAALGAGFEVAHISAETLRMESGVPVAGLLVTLLRPGARGGAHA
jgi:predicted TPR repeat methyltransferase